MVVTACARAQGHCNGGTVQTPSTGPPFAPLTPYQCVIITRDRLFQFNEGDNAWVDNLYIRGARTGPKPDFFNLNGANNMRAYWTRVTFQGDGQDARALDPFNNSRVSFTGAQRSDVIRPRRLGW
jgi:hypothetical protein